jgi:hypothetical protein
MSDLKHLSQSLNKVTRHICERKYIKMGRILTHWDDIVGADISTRCYPVKIRNQRRNGTYSTSVLDIATSSAQAMILSYRKELILQRINLLFGEELVTDLRFLHKDSGHQNVPPSPVFTPENRALSIEQQDCLKKMIETVDDDGLKQRIESLYLAFLYRQSKGKI